MRVGLVKGWDRYENIRNALELIKDEIELPRKQILLKPNFVSTTNSLAATHPDAIRAVMDFFLELGAKSFLIGEASAEHTPDGFRNFGYLDLERSYPVRLLDLNCDSWVETEILDRSFRILKVRVSKRALNSYRISVTRPKTHDTAIVTLALKNMAVGSLIGSDKGLIHQGYKVFNLNLVKLAALTAPHLAVIDGVVGMEGEGPCFGTTISSGFTVASTNGLACDLVAAALMGFDPSNIGYLWYGCRLGLGPKSLDEVEVVGERIKNCAVNFRPHSSYREQLGWKLVNWKEALAKIMK